MLLAWSTPGLGGLGALNPNWCHAVRDMGVQTGAETVDNVDVFRDAGGGATTVCGTQARDSPSAGTARASSGAERPR